MFKPRRSVDSGACSLYDSVLSKVEQVNRYLDETDLQEEFFRKMKSFGRRISESDIVRRISDPSRRGGTRRTNVRELRRRITVATLTQNSARSTTISGDDKQIKHPLHTNDVHNKMSANTRSDGSQSTSRPDSSISKTRDSQARRISVSWPVSLDQSSPRLVYPPVSGVKLPRRNRTSETDPKPVSSGIQTDGRPKQATLQSKSLCQPSYGDSGVTFPQHQPTLRRRRKPNTEAKIYLSSEYSTEEKQCSINMRQFGNVWGEENNNKLYLKFRAIDYKGKVMKKKVRKLEYDSVTNDFFHTHAFQIPFESFDVMNYSGWTIQIKLKCSSLIGRDKTLKETKIAMADVEDDPVWRNEKLFYQGPNPVKNDKK